MKEIISPETNTLIKKENNFDFIRYFFAFSLIITHFCGLSGIGQFWFVTGSTRVKAFFIISGFLVFNSYLRKPINKDYFKKRIKRILPPYLFVVILCFLGGIFLTSLSTKEYLQDPDSYKYIIANFSFLNFIQPTLPGVFLDNPTQPVNGSLWSMKVEVLFYLSVPFVFFLLRKYNKLGVMLGIFAFSIAYNELFIYLYNKSGNFYYMLIKRQIGSQFIYFYSGTFILLYFQFFTKYLKYLFPLSLVIYFIYSYYSKGYVLRYLEPLAFATLIIGFAYNFKYLNFLRKYDNISYGIYLFHYPIIQTLINYKLETYNIYLTFFLAIFLTILISLFSWHIIEKPIINYKRAIK